MDCKKRRLPCSGVMKVQYCICSSLSGQIKCTFFKSVLTLNNPLYLLALDIKIIDGADYTCPAILVPIVKISVYATHYLDPRHCKLSCAHRICRMLHRMLVPTSGEPVRRLDEVRQGTYGV